MKKGIIIFSTLVFLLLFVSTIPAAAQLEATPQTVNLELTLPSSISLEVSTASLVWDTIPASYPGSPAWYASPTFQLIANIDIPPGESANLNFIKDVYFANTGDASQTFTGPNSKLVCESGLPVFTEEFLNGLGTQHLMDSLDATTTADMHFEVYWDQSQLVGTYTCQVTFELICPTL